MMGRHHLSVALDAAVLTIDPRGLARTKWSPWEDIRLQRPPKATNQSAKNKVQNSEEFFGREKDHQPTIFYHASHHKITTKIPRSAATICQNPCKNTTPPHKEKNKHSWAGSSYSVNR
jgi:hypothetical protein